MKKICTITQTYSDHRNELFFYHDLDKSDIDFRNKFDGNFYSFHNCSDNYFETISKLDYFQSLKNLTFVRQNGISYPQTFKNLIEFVKNEGYDYIIFLQDDVFTISKDKKIHNEIYEYIINNDFDMLNLETKFSELETDKSVIYEKDELCVYDTETNDYLKKNMYSFDDGPYIAKIDFISKFIYDEDYYAHGDIWSAETYLHRKISNTNLKRYTLNTPIYYRCNMVGRNDWNRENVLKEMNEYFYEEIQNIQDLSLNPTKT